MPENQIPATQPEPGAAPGEFNFDNPPKENPRIKRRSLKAKPGSLLTPSGGMPPAARELEREAPPLSAEQVVKPPSQKAEQVKIEPAVKIAETPIAPPRTTPSPASATTSSPSRPASGGGAPKATTATPASTSSPAASPHGTRPATLYYSSQPRKDKEASPPMKTIPTASPASSSSASSTGTLPSSVARSAASSPRPATTVDYRANMERQAREQKSVGNILNYVVYGLIGFFVISAGLAAYGADVIFKQIHDQSVTVGDLDQHYAKITHDLTASLATTQDALTQAQAQITRQQDLIVKQQEDLNRLIAAMNDNESAIKQEKQSRAQETASLRARVRDLENRPNYTQKY